MYLEGADETGQATRRKEKRELYLYTPQRTEKKPKAREKKRDGEKKDDEGGYAPEAASKRFTITGSWPPVEEEERE